jgi:hypothetical protein
MPPTTLPAVAAHGARRLPSVDLDSYNVELKDDEGFIGDRASKGAFRKSIESWRSSLRKLGTDPLGEDASEELSKKKLRSVSIWFPFTMIPTRQVSWERFTSLRHGCSRRSTPSSAWIWAARTSAPVLSSSTSKQRPTYQKRKCGKFSLWRHGDGEGIKREHELTTATEPRLI